MSKLNSNQGLDAFKQEWSLVLESEGEGTVISVDCSANPNLCREFDVVSFPAIRLHLQDGTTERYRGPRKAKE